MTSDEGADVVPESPVAATKFARRPLVPVGVDDARVPSRFARRLSPQQVQPTKPAVVPPAARTWAATSAALPISTCRFDWMPASAAVPVAARPAAAPPSLTAVVRQGGLLQGVAEASFSRSVHRSTVALPALLPTRQSAPVDVPSQQRSAEPEFPARSVRVQERRPAAAAAPEPEIAAPERRLARKRDEPSATGDDDGEEDGSKPKAAAQPKKRARSTKPVSAGNASRKASRSEKGNFVRLNLGKGKRFAGAGGRKFVNGAGKSKKRFTKFYRKRPVLPDSAAPPAPVLVDDAWEPPQAAPQGATAELPQTAPQPAPVVMSAELVDAIAAAQTEHSADRLQDVLQQVFGFAAFRDGQLDVVQRILAGRSCFSILPTGQGKSLCYQLASLLLPGVTLVVSPLVALMEDQLRHLPPALPGAVLHSGQSTEHGAATVQALRQGQLKVLFVSPERLLTRRFLHLAASLPENAKFTLACVDECHCVSEWSHNFRPAYYRLGRVLRHDIGVSHILALTATATRRTEAAVAAHLGIPAEDVLRNASVRDNLRLTVSREVDRERALLAMLKPGGVLANTQGVIAYCSYKAEADRVASFLYTHGVTALSYHAGKSAAERSRTQAMFLSNRVRAVCATVAFGMGLDKPNVGAVVNFGLPHSVEAYVQQVGRGGRNGSVAQCHTFLDDQEYLRLRSLAFSDGVEAPTLLRMLQHVFSGAQTGAEGCIVLQAVCQDWDMRPEAVETVLSYLQMDGCMPGLAPLLASLPDIRATIRLSFHKSNPSDLATTCPLVARVLELGKQRMGKYTASIPELARDLGESFASVQETLQALSRSGEVSFTLADQAVCYEVLREPADLPALADALARRLSDAEQCQVNKLDALYSIVNTAARETSHADQEHIIRERVRAYFDADADAELQPPPELVKQSSQYLVADIRSLLRQGKHSLTTSRSVARVLHGLSSSQVTAETWRQHPSWGKHVAVDFHAVMRAAEVALQSLV